MNIRGTIFWCGRQAGLHLDYNAQHHPANLGCPVLSVEQLTITADPRSHQPLLDPLSLTVNPGQAVGLIGPSGCGKTTLLRSIAALIDPLTGAVTLDNKTPAEIGWPAFRRRVTLVPQRPVVWDGTVWDNIQRPHAFQSVKNTIDSDYAERTLELVGLIDKLNSQATELSEGERQRICLVRSLLAKPDFILLDEPTSALDSESIQRVQALLTQQMADNSLGILIATHANHFADRFCTRTINLSTHSLARQEPTNA